MQKLLSRRTEKSENVEHLKKAKKIRKKLKIKTLANKCQQRLLLIYCGYIHIYARVYSIHVCCMAWTLLVVAVIVVSTHHILCKLSLNITLQRHTTTLNFPNDIQFKNGKWGQAMLRQARRLVPRKKPRQFMYRCLMHTVGGECDIY